MNNLLHKAIIGLDLAKNVFHAVDPSKEKKAGRKKLRRAQVLPYFANHPASK